MSIITLTPDTLPNEHICCAFSDKKCASGYQAKKHWLSEQYANGYRFTRLDERGKVFLEYGPSEHAWMPIIAPDWMVMGCFWVSGRFKGQGHGKALLNRALDDVKSQGRKGLVTVAGVKKMHFQSDGKWLRRQGFKQVDQLDNGFCLLALNITDQESSTKPQFAASAKAGLSKNTKGLTVYYSDRCPYTNFYVETQLVQTAHRRGLPLNIIKLDTMSAAQNAPSPATIFSLFVDDQFVTTDLSVCLDHKFDKIIAKHY